VPQLIAALDALILTGGEDVDPVHYGQPLHPATRGIDPDRDRFELDLTRIAIERGLPLLGICRGIQVLNVALGGTLIQDIPCPGVGSPGPPKPGGRSHLPPITCVSNQIAAWQP